MLFQSVSLLSGFVARSEEFARDEGKGGEKKTFEVFFGGRRSEGQWASLQHFRKISELVY